MSQKSAPWTQEGFEPGFSPAQLEPALVTADLSGIGAQSTGRSLPSRGDGHEPIRSAEPG